MIGWFNGGDASKGQRKLTGLTRALGAAVLVTLGGEALLLALPHVAHGPAASIVQFGLGTIAGLYAAMVGGNAAEHRHRKTGKKDAPPAESAG